MNVRSALDRLIDLEERVGHLYILLYKRFVDLPGVADLWWEMALEEHGHAGILKMVRALADPATRVKDLRPRLQPLEALIRGCERQVARISSLQEALAIAVRLERSELDRLGRETMRGIARTLPEVPRSAFAPHEAHLDRLTRTVRKFGGEEVLREAWALSPEARGRRAESLPARHRSAGPRPPAQTGHRKAAASR
ncbi:MAG: hypothetical protein EHM71_15555 [Zetaproteobacteria bacterium]|nr:MAG: hypothetical protein EHM71_15555 [Zetaproteobacteria bacterium]